MDLYLENSSSGIMRLSFLTASEVGGGIKVPEKEIAMIIIILTSTW